jgi:DNA polymerase/3'-5' exonuclease PolX
MTDYRPLIIENLTILQKTSKAEEGGAFKSRVYAKAIATLTAGGPIHSMEDVPTAKHVGIGDKVRLKIQEILETGSLQAAEVAKTKAPEARELFENIYGVGPKKAAELAATYSSIADLRAAVAAKTLTLTRNQLIGLRVYEDLLLRIPRPEMLEHEKVIKSLIPDATLVGSFRRGLATSGDIDVIVSGPLKTIIESFKASGYLTDILAEGESKCLAVCRLPGLPGLPYRRIDFLSTPKNEVPFSLLYFTGSDRFNVAMRAKASDMGYRLNEHGLLQIKMNIFVSGIKTEKDIFKCLGMDWVEPCDR